MPRRAEKASMVARKLGEMKLKEAAKPLHMNREVRRRTRIVGTFLESNSALMLVCTKLRHVTNKVWGTKRYMSMTRLYE